MCLSASGPYSYASFLLRQSETTSLAATVEPQRYLTRAHFHPSLPGEKPGELFVPEGHHWIDLRGLARRDITSGQGDYKEQDRDCSERHRVRWTDTVKQAREIARHTQRRRDADRSSRKRQENPLPHDKPQHIASAGANRHADADLARPAGYFIGEQAVETDRGQHEGKYAKETRRGVR